MKTLTEHIHHFLSLLHSVKDKNLAWQATNQDQQIKLSHECILAEKKLAAELAKKSVALAHEIDLLKTSQHAELAMLKTRCKEDIKDYQQYLESLNHLKQAIKTSYAHLPDAINLTIHHHAKSLLNAMWEAENLEEKIKREAQLIEFMTTVHEETKLCRTGMLSDKLPENTLKLINQSKHYSLPH
jgi:cell division protein FtsB